MPNGRDPTQTTTLRNRYGREWRRRWRAAAGDIQALAENGGDFLPGGRFAPVGGAREAAQRFARVSRPIIDHHVFDDRAWIEPYLKHAAVVGIRHANRDFAGRGGNLADPNDVIRRFHHAQFLARQIEQTWEHAVIVAGDVQTGIAQALGELLEREGLPAVSAAGRPTMRTHAANREQIRKVLGRALNTGGYRTDVNGRTNIVGTVNESALNRYHDLGVEEVGARIEIASFMTAGDDDVCPVCEGLENQENGYGPGVFRIDQARGMIPVHYNCRCLWTDRRRIEDPAAGLIRSFGLGR